MTSAGSAHWTVECNDMNRDEPNQRRDQQEALSSLMDGEADAADQACRAWRDDAGARADWHTYHVIGEVMRSDDVRARARHDAAFLGRLRERLATEAVVLAPASRPSLARPRAPWRQAWVAPMAVAAGFVAVAGVLVLTRVAAPDGAAPEQSASLAAPAAAQRPAALEGLAVSSAPSASAMVGTNGQLIRNAELDRYLAAHQQYGNTAVLAVPGGAVRKAATLAPGR